MLELWTLGRLDLLDDAGRRCEALPAQPKCFGLLCYLAVAYPGVFCRRDTLLAMYWPDLDERHARGALRQVLFGLRKVCGPDVILNRGDHGVGVAESLVWCDATAFDGFVRREEYQEALGLYAGDFLPGFHLSGTPEFERWVDHERENRRRAAVAAARTLSTEARALGDVSVALERAREALDLAPYDEPSWCLLFELLSEHGDRAGLALAFGDLEHRLEDDLGLSPSPETHALYARLKGREPSVRAEPERPVELLPPPDSDLAERVPEPRAQPPPLSLRARLKHRGGLALLATVLLVLALGFWGASFLGAPRTALPGVFVMPVVTLSRAYEDIEFATALTHEIESRLAAAPGLWVSMNHRLSSSGDEETALQRARTLGATLVLMCDFHKMGPRVRIHTRLVDAASGQLLSIAPFERSVEDLAGLEVEVANRVAVEVIHVLSEIEASRQTGVPHP